MGLWLQKPDMTANSVTQHPVGGSSLQVTLRHPAFCERSNLQVASSPAPKIKSPKGFSILGSQVLGFMVPECTGVRIVRRSSMRRSPLVLSLWSSGVWDLALRFGVQGLGLLAL